MNYRDSLRIRAKRAMMVLREYSGEENKEEVVAALERLALKALEEHQARNQVLCG